MVPKGGEEKKRREKVFWSYKKKCESARGHGVKVNNGVKGGRWGTVGLYFEEGSS